MLPRRGRPADHGRALTLVHRPTCGRQPTHPSITAFDPDRWVCEGLRQAGRSA